MTVFSSKFLIAAPSVLIVIGATLTGAIPARAQAQSQSDNPGSIIVSREVYYRSAIAPSVPGPAVRVDTSPDDIVIAATSLGLKPLTEDEAATLSAPLSQAGSTARQASAGMSAQLALAQGQRTFAPGQLAGGSASGGMVGQAMGALPTALGSLRAALGGGQ